MAEMFRELHGEYVDNVGQQLSLREYLDYFEPLGSALARLPDGAGGPFVHHFTDGGGRTISALGWVVSAKSKRFGGWKLWGMWTDGAMSPVALPVFWPVLADPARTPEWVRRANEKAELLVDGDRGSELLKTLKAPRLRDEPFRELLKAELARAYAVPLPHRHPLEIEVAPQTLDLLPWLYLLGPVDPSQARLQPNRFNGAGYQYILTDSIPSGSDVEIPREIDAIVDGATKNVATGVRLADEFRARREHPPLKPARPRERSDMRSPTSPPSPSRPARTAVDVWKIADAAWKLAVLLLLAWIAWNVNVIRKSAATQPAAAAAVETQTTTTSSAAPVAESDPADTRIHRITSALRARPPRNIAVSAAMLDEIQAEGSEEKLARVAIEIFLRRNRCYTGAEAADGRFSAAEQRAIRACKSLENARLMKDRTEPDAARAIQWLQEMVGQ
jgi:hypothetical protein